VGRGKGTPNGAVEKRLQPHKKFIVNLSPFTLTVSSDIMYLYTVEK
jgi:hypothetical protein